jgi:hypothetical protein
MKTFPSPTANGGQTIILDTVQDAIQHGATWLDNLIASYEERGDQKISVTKVKRDGPAGASKTMNSSTFAAKWKEGRERFRECCTAIVSGDPALKAEITGTLEALRDAAVEIAPMLAVGYRGYQRSEDGFTAAPELVAAGEENPCFQRKPGSDEITKRSGDGAYRIVVNTDVAWWGKPADNAAVMGALVTLLQQFGPVEIWIQQGWLGSPGEHAAGDGVTLFKLDFTGSFDATQLAFWLGHKYKDTIFSHIVNRGLGRQNTHTSTTSEIPCDLYLRGDWMTLHHVTASALAAMTHIERIDTMAQWIAKTAMQIIHPDNPETTIQE